MSISQLVRENEKQWRSDREITDRLMEVWQVMHASFKAEGDVALCVELAQFVSMFVGSQLSLKGW